MSGIIKKLFQRRIQNYKDFLNFVFFEELSKIEILCEYGIFCMILFTFSVTFLQIKIFSIKIVFQIFISWHKMNKLRVPNSLKAIKKTSSGLIYKFTIKKNWILFESSFFYKTFQIFSFLSHLETSHFSYRGSVNDKPHSLVTWSPINKKTRFQGIALVFLASTISFRNFNWKVFI